MYISIPATIRQQNHKIAALLSHANGTQWYVDFMSAESQSQLKEMKGEWGERTHGFLNVNLPQIDYKFSVILANILADSFSGNQQAYFELNVCGHQPLR